MGAAHWAPPLPCVCRLTRGGCKCVLIFDSLGRVPAPAVSGLREAGLLKVWARQLAKPPLPSQLSLVVWPCGRDTASRVQTLGGGELTWNKDKTFNLICSNLNNALWCVQIDKYNIICSLLCPLLQPLWVPPELKVFKCLMCRPRLVGNATAAHQRDVHVKLLGWLFTLL